MTGSSPPIPSDGVSALVLGAGRGERFGTPKAFAFLGGQTLLEKAVDAVSAFADEVIAGFPVCLIEGDPENQKIAFPLDIAVPDVD